MSVYLFLQATLGGTIQVPTLMGDVVVKVWFPLLTVFVGNIGISYQSEMSGQCSLFSRQSTFQWSFGRWSLLCLSGVLMLAFGLQVRPGTQPGQKVVLKQKGESNLLPIQFPASFYVFIVLIAKRKACMFFLYICPFFDRHKDKELLLFWGSICALHCQHPNVGSLS